MEHALAEQVLQNVAKDVAESLHRDQQSFPEMVGHSWASPLFRADRNLLVRVWHDGTQWAKVLVFDIIGDQIDKRSFREYDATPGLIDGLQRYTRPARLPQHVD